MSDEASYYREKRDEYYYRARNIAWRTGKPRPAPSAFPYYNHRTLAEVWG